MTITIIESNNKLYTFGSGKMNAKLINGKIYIVGTIIDALCVTHSNYPIVIVDEKMIPTVDLMKHSKQKTTRPPRPPRRKMK